MIGYVMLGSNDLPRAIAFYDALLAGLGATRGFSHERFQFYVTGNQAAPSLAICTPHDGQAAVPGNGTMVALAAPSRAVVNEMHAKALSLGGADEGAPGTRGGENSGFYGAYFRDLDGNKLCVFAASREA